MVKILVLGDPHGKLPKNINSIVKKNNVKLILITGDLGKADLARKRYFENLELMKKGLKKLVNDKNHMKAVYDEIHYTTINIARTISKIVPTYSLQGNVGIINKSTAKKDAKKFGVNFPCTKCEIDKIKNFNLVKNRLRIIDNLRIGFLEHFSEVVRGNKKKAKVDKEIQKAKDILKRFGKVDILVCHAPPYGYLDKINGKFGAPKKDWANI